VPLTALKRSFFASEPGFPGVNARPAKPFCVVTVVMGKIAEMVCPSACSQSGPDFFLERDLHRLHTLDLATLRDFDDGKVHLAFISEKLQCAHLYFFE